MMTIQKPKRIWQKKKDYNKKKLIRKIRRRNKTSFDGGKDESYSDLKTNRPIIIGPGLLSVITPIKKANRGKFTEAANEHNMGVQEFVRQVLSAPKGKYSSTLRKRANFARNFAH